MGRVCNKNAWKIGKHPKKSEKNLFLLLSYIGLSPNPELAAKQILKFALASSFLFLQETNNQKRNPDEGTMQCSCLW